MGLGLWSIRLQFAVRLSRSRCEREVIVPSLGDEVF